MPLTISNRSTEKDVRDWLDNNGFAGKTAKLNEFELHAIQRPGWIQVFKFCVTVKFLPLSNQGNEPEPNDRPGWLEMFGGVLDDERERDSHLKTQVWLFEDEVEREKKLNLVSADFLTCQQGQTGELVATAFFTLIVLSITIVVLSWFQ
jgi:hypothetical protein